MHKREQFDAASVESNHANQTSSFPTTSGHIINSSLGTTLPLVIAEISTHLRRPRRLKMLSPREGLTFPSFQARATDGVQSDTKQLR